MKLVVVAGGLVSWLLLLLLFSVEPVSSDEECSVCSVFCSRWFACEMPRLLIRGTRGGSSSG